MIDIIQTPNYWPEPVTILRPVVPKNSENGLTTKTDCVMADNEEQLCS